MATDENEIHVRIDPASLCVRQDYMFTTKVARVICTNQTNVHNINFYSYVLYKDLDPVASGGSSIPLDAWHAMTLYHRLQRDI